MPHFDIITEINAPVERCYDLSLSVDLHVQSTWQTRERVVSGKTNGLLTEGEAITWEAQHLGRRRRLRSRVENSRRPFFFISRMVQGDFRVLVHEHHFTPQGDKTIMHDKFYFEAPYGIFGKLAALLFLKRYLRKFLLRRNATIKAAAESDDWKKFL